MSDATSRQVLAVISAAATLGASIVALGVIGVGQTGVTANARAITADATDIGVDLSGPGLSAPGGRAVWRLSVTNRSTVTAAAVLVTHTLPVSVSLDSMSAGGVEVSSGIVVWSLGDLVGPITRTFEITGRISPELDIGESITAHVEIASLSADAGFGDNFAELRTTLGAHDLRPSIAPSSSTVRPSERLTYTVGIDNVSMVTADDVVLTVTLGAGLDLIADSAAAAGFVRRVPDADAGVVEYEVARRPGPSSIDFSVSVRAGEELNIGQVVTASVSVGSASRDVTIGGREEHAPPVTIVMPDLMLSIRGGELTALGSESLYRSYWSNGIGAAARRAIMTATLPASVTYVTSTPPADLVDGTPIGPARLQWFLGPAPGGSGEIAGPQLVVRHDGALGAGGAFTTSFEIWDGVRDASPGDNSVARRTNLYSSLASRLELIVPTSMVVGMQDSLRVLAVDGREAWVSDGTIAHFEASEGSITETMPSTVDGVATTGYRAPFTAGVVDFAVSVDGLRATAGVVISPGLPMTVTPTTASPNSTVGDSVTFEVAVRDRYGNPVSDGTIVRAETSNGLVTPLSGQTVGGIVEFEWTAERAGLQSITFLAGPEESEVFGTGVVEWFAGPPARVMLSAEPRTIGAAGGLVAVGAAVFDDWDNPVGDGVPVQFAAGGGSFARPVETTRGGLATGTWTSGIEIGDIGLTATVAREGAHAQPPLVADVIVKVEPADLGITASLSGPRGPLDDTAQIHPGEKLSLTLGVRNAGLATARGVIVSARLPTPLLEVTATAADVPLPEPVDPPVSVGPDAWSVPDMVPGGEITVTVTGRFDESYTWTGADLFFVRGAVTSTTPEASAFDLVRTAQVRVTSSDVFIGVGIDGSASTLGPGGRLVYDIGVGNLQPQTIASGGIITSTLPTGTHFDHWSIPSGATLRLEEATPLDADSRTLVWRVVGPVPLSSAFRLWLNIDKDVRGDTELINRLEIDSGVHDIDAVNNVAAATVRLPGGVNLVAEVAGSSAAHADEVVEHDLIIRNLARTEPAANVIVNSYLPPDIEILDVAEPGRIVAPGRAQWQFERLGPGGRPALWIKWKVPETARVGDTIAHRVEATSDDDDSNPSDNESTMVTTIIPGPPNMIELSADPTTLDTCPTGRVVIGALVTDVAGNSVPDGTEVNWSSSLGVFDVSKSTTADGKAAASLVVDGLTGSANVSAFSGARVGTLDIALRAGLASDIALGVSPNVGIVGEAMVIRVALNDACGNPVADGTLVRIAVSRGDLGGGALERVVPVDGGIASATLTVGAAVGPLRVEAAAVDAPSVHAEIFIRVEARATSSALIWLPYTVRGTRARAALLRDFAQFEILAPAFRPDRLPPE